MVNESRPAAERGPARNYWRTVRQCFVILERATKTAAQRNYESPLPRRVIVLPWPDTDTANSGGRGWRKSGSHGGTPGNRNSRYATRYRPPMPRESKRGFAYCVQNDVQPWPTGRSVGWYTGCLAEMVLRAFDTKVFFGFFLGPICVIHEEYTVTKGSFE
ncbi:hypothetical protein KM043_014891 [Ampulex compressa]|nr:hypothetical protein KM043_014891 [Ampulex compressa]